MKDDDEKGPNRTCAVTRTVRPIADLIRFVVGPDGSLVPDIRAKLPGRGVWVETRRPRIGEAIQRKAFARSLKQPVVVPDGLADWIETLLTDDARQSLAIANKAGFVVSGFSKVESALAGGDVVALLCARDGAADGRRKLKQVLHRVSAGYVEVPVLHSPFLSAEMDLALGRENVIHAALRAGPASDAFLQRCLRLVRYRADDLDETGPDGGDAPPSSGPFSHGAQDDEN